MIWCKVCGQSLSNMKKVMLIAPCGINCSLCVAFQRGKNKCLGCNARGNLYKHCLVCKIENCEEQTKSGFCYSCKMFPCKRLKQLEVRYKTKYGVSVIGNLQTIEMQGVNKFKKMERVKMGLL